MGIDASEAFAAAAKTLGLDARVMNAEDLTFRHEFDAVFSNAVLHWITRADPMSPTDYRERLDRAGFVVQSIGLIPRPTPRPC